MIDCMVRLSDEQWEHIRKHFPEENIPPDRAGRKPVPTRKVLEGVLWILNTGAQWQMLPQCYPNYKTVHRQLSTMVHGQHLARFVDGPGQRLAQGRGQWTRGSALLTGCFPRPKRERRGDRRDEARKRRQNHGHSGSAQSAVVGQYARGEPSRSDRGAVEF